MGFERKLKESACNMQGHHGNLIVLGRDCSDYRLLGHLKLNIG